MATNNKINSVVTKSLAYPFNKPQARPTSRASWSHGLPWGMTASDAWAPKIQSFEDSINPNWTREERILFELKSGDFMVAERDPWTQAEVDAAWSRRNTPTSVSQPSQAFFLNRDFKSEAAVEQSSQVDEEVDEQDLYLPFQYKPDPNN